MCNFIMMVGISGSGKSYYCDNLRKENTEIVYLSSDEIREEVFRDVNDQSHNTEVFNIMNTRTIDALAAGKDVVYDATNLNAKRRMGFLSSIHHIPNVRKIAVVVATPYEQCLRNNWMRERKVPDEVMKRQYMNFQCPYYFEGWDEIRVLRNSHYAIKYNIVDALKDYHQNNPHHKNTLSSHLWKTGDYVNKKYPSSNELVTAAYLHDVGKPFCRFEDEGGISHYNRHENVGAYDALSVYFCSLYTTVLINYHMMPIYWKSSTSVTKTAAKYRKMWGENMFNDVMALHEADNASLE